MVYVYRRSASTGARELAEALSGRRYRANQRPITQVVQRGDVIVCWGEALPAIPGVLILNGGPILSKFSDAERLRERGVSTIQVSRTQPIAVDPAVALFETVKSAAEDFAALAFSRSQPLIDGVGSLITNFTSLR